MNEPAYNLTDTAHSVAASYASNGTQRADIIGEALAVRSVQVATEQMQVQYNQFMDVFA